MQLGYGIFIIPLTSIVQHVSSVMSLIIRNLNCIRASGLKNTCGDRSWCRLSGNCILLVIYF
jgi:hypothetical protein